MKRIILFLFLASCLNDPYAAPAHYVIFGPYCWHEDEPDHTWRVKGLSHACPPNTRPAERLRGE